MAGAATGCQDLAHAPDRRAEQVSAGCRGYRIRTCALDFGQLPRQSGERVRLVCVLATYRQSLPPAWRAAPVAATAYLARADRRMGGWLPQGAAAVVGGCVLRVTGQDRRAQR